VARDYREDFERRLLALIRDHFEWVDEEYLHGYDIGDFVVTWHHYQAPDPNETLKPWYGGPYPGWSTGQTTLGSSPFLYDDEVLLDLSLGHIRDRLEEWKTGDKRIEETAGSDEADARDEFAANAYLEFREYAAWGVVERAINDLVENQDIDETTVHELIVGYMVKSLAEAGLLAK
jgi:hypothetical protein